MKLIKEKKEKEEETSSIYILSPPTEASKIRMTKLFGDLTEDKAEDIMQSLFEFQRTGTEEIPEDPTDPESPTKEVINKPIDFYISTWGGGAHDMFAIYDTMRTVREDCDIDTYGLGKVMSAGVLLLAAGTKGRRKIGKCCRVMIHSAVGDPWGPIHNLENEMDEIRWIQEQHINSLVEETNLTKRQLKKMLNRKVNVYLNAEQAVEYGIVDIIV